MAETSIDPLNRDTGFMLSVAVRYCLDRHSYAPALCCDWLRAHWHLLAVQDQRGIARDIRQHIETEAQRSEYRARCPNLAPPGWECDLRTWEHMAAWIAEADTALIAQAEQGGPHGVDKSLAAEIEAVILKHAHTYTIGKSVRFIANADIKNAAAEIAALQSRAFEDGARWRTTGKAFLAFGGEGTREWFRPSDGALRNYPTGFDPNDGAYTGMVIVNASLQPEGERNA